MSDLVGDHIVGFLMTRLIYKSFHECRINHFVNSVFSHCVIVLYLEFYVFILSKHCLNFYVYHNSHHCCFFFSCHFHFDINCLVKILLLKEAKNDVDGVWL